MNLCKYALGDVLDVREKRYKTNLATAPLALADSLETSLPLYIQRKFLMNTVKCGKDSKK